MFNLICFNRQFAQGLLFSLAALLPLSVAAQTGKTFINSIGIAFILMPPGEFIMGCGENDSECKSDEKPQHRVKISQPFYLGKFEVTQAQWEKVMGSNPSKFKGQSNPIENVSWDDVQVFIQRLNGKEGSNKYRLPSEAEWEYAARAGTTSRYSFGDDVARLGRYAWYTDNSGGQTHPVGQKQPIRGVYMTCTAMS